MDKNGRIIKLRGNWTAPLIISPTNHKKIIITGQMFYLKVKTEETAGRVISPDLTKNYQTWHDSAKAINMSLSPAYTGSEVSGTIRTYQ